MRGIFLSFLISFTLFADSNITKTMNDIRCDVSNRYYNLLNNIDCYLADYDDINGSNYKIISKNKLYIILSLKDYKGSFKGSVRIRGKIKFPKLEDKIELTFSQQGEDRRENEEIDSESEDFLDDKNLHVGLKYYAYKEFHSSAYAKLSLSLHSPIGLYTKIGVDKSYFYDTHQVIFNHGLYYYINDNSFTFSTSVSFFMPFGLSHSLEQKNRWYWDGSKDKAVLENSLSIYQFYDLKNRFRYRVTYASVDDDECNYCRDWYGMSIKYHHQINSWYFVEIMPQMLRERENNFKYDKIITLNFGVTLSR